MRYTDVKANVKQEIIWWLCLTDLYKKYLQNLKYNEERACVFHLILVGIQSILILCPLRRGGGGGGGCLTDNLFKPDESYLLVP